MLGDTSTSFWQRVMLYSSLANKVDASAADWYEMLEAYYWNNGLYDLVQQSLYENAIWVPAMKSFRNPAHRAVEFYVSKLWPGNLPSAMPIVAKNARIVAAIDQIDQWSNWSQNKQTLARWFAMYGDMFIKIETKGGPDGKTAKSVYKKNIKPAHVTDFKLDERGYITFIRIDVPVRGKMHTEVWDKEKNLYSRWEHKRNATAKLAELGDPLEVKAISDFSGIDFIPIVHAKFIDVGDTRGVGCFVHALDKIDEANRQATRLHQILFRYNKALTAIMANGTDASGRPLPAPVITDGDGERKNNGDVFEQNDDDDLVSLPGMAKVEQLVPNINYEAALSILNAQMKEIANDLPEILYFDLVDKGDVSGVALERMLGPAIDKVIDARGSGEAAIVRANQMALTLASAYRLEGFSDLGKYENGDFDHSFAKRDVIPMSAKERAEVVKAEVDMGSDLPSAMRRHGYEEKTIEEVVASESYKLQVKKLLMEGAKAAADANIPLETFLRWVGVGTAEIGKIGTELIADIQSKQQDAIPPFQQ